MDFTLIFPNQLFEKHPALKQGRRVILVEEFLFFRQYKFHKRKIAFHRASMKFYEHYLTENGYEVTYVEAAEQTADIRELLPFLAKKGVKTLHLAELNDDWLERRLKKGAAENSLDLKVYDSPMFLNNSAELAEFFADKEKLSQTDFYRNQRKKHKILVDYELKPIGGKWTFDTENRKKYPKDKTLPVTRWPNVDRFWREAIMYTSKNFGDNPGELKKFCKTYNYPVTYNSARRWLDNFLKQRLAEFGDYEDAMVAGEMVLNHSVLSPMLNVGLLTPKEILEKTLKFAEKKEVTLNSLEGFVRQVLGWREFIHGVYRFKGREERTNNFWQFSRKLPQSFYDGTTGIVPVDEVIKKVLKTGYCHHIERLMVLGNFMLLCEIEPNEAYRWFMELFIDAYDWVMVPNVYGMSQFADGGIMSTKPYISGSNYLMKMSDFAKGEWQQVWDGLFWRFIDRHREFFLKNPRLAMMVKMFDKMDVEKREQHLKVAENFLSKL